MSLQRVIAGIPRAPRALQGPGALPALSSLEGYTLEELLAVLGRFGLESDLATIEANATDAWKRLEKVLSEGRQPDEATWAAIEQRIESQVVETVRQQVKAAIRNREMGLNRDRDAHLFIWITVGDSRVCDSCEPRHGEQRSLAYWDAHGPPGSASLVCGLECRCKLIPVFDPPPGD